MPSSLGPAASSGADPSGFAILSPTAALKRELRVRVDLHTNDAPTRERLAKLRARLASGGRPRASTAGGRARASTVLASIADTLARGSRASDARTTRRLGEDDAAARLAKLYVFADAVVFAEPTLAPQAAAP